MASISELSGITAFAILSALNPTAAVASPGEPQPAPAVVQPAPTKRRGGRARKYATNAERQAAYGARKSNADAIAEVLRVNPTNDMGPMYLPDADQGKGKITTGGYNGKKIDDVTSAQIREGLLGIPKNLLGSMPNMAEEDLARRIGAGRRREVVPPGAGPPRDDDNDGDEAGPKESANQTEDRFIRKVTRRKLKVTAAPLATRAYVESIKRAFCPVHSPVQPGPLPDGADFISGKPVVMFHATYDPATRDTWKMSCGCSRTLPRRKSRKADRLAEQKD